MRTQTRFMMTVGASLCLLGMSSSVMAETNKFSSVSGVFPTLIGQTAPGSAQTSPESPTAPTTPSQPMAPQPGMPPTGGMPAGQQGTPAGQPQSGATGSDFSIILADAINNMEQEVQKLKAIDNNKLQTIRAVNVKTLLKEKKDSEALQTAMNQNQSQRQEMQSAIGENALLKKTLTDNRIEIARIVAVSVTDPQNLVVFYQ